MSSANRAARDKYLKWNPGETGEAKRNVSSADGHARKARIARAKKDNPKLVAQLKKDLKYELESGSLSLLSKLRSAETASRCLGCSWRDTAWWCDEFCVKSLACCSS